NSFKSTFEDVTVAFQQIEKLEIVRAVRSVITEIYQRIIKTFSLLHDQLAGIFHFPKITSHLTSDDGQALAEKTSQIAADIFVQPEDSLMALHNVLPIVMSAAS